MFSLVIPERFVGAFKSATRTTKHFGINNQGMQASHWLGSPPQRCVLAYGMYSSGANMPVYGTDFPYDYNIILIHAEAEKILIHHK